MTAGTPSLLRRLVLLQVLAFAGVGSLLYAWFHQRSLAPVDGEFDRELRAFAHALLPVITSAGGEEQARDRLVAVLGHHHATAGRPEHAAPPFEARLLGTDGRLLYASPRVNALPPAGTEGFFEVAGAGGAWRGYRLRAAPYQLEVYQALLERRRSLTTGLRADLAGPLGLALLLVLLPTLAAVWAGLAPLRRLTRELSARSAENLDPLLTRAEHAEVLPLLSALDTTLGRLRAAQAREQTLLAEIAHELRTPLATLAADLDALAAAGAPTPVLARLRRASARAAHLISQLLCLARLEATPPVEPSRLDLSELVREAASRHAEAARDRGLEFFFDGPDQCAVLADPFALGSVLDNLLDNALRHAEGARRLSIHLAAAGGAVTLRVADDGVGVPAPSFAQLGERFANVGAAPHRGARLGLAIVRQAAARLGADLAFGPGLDGRGLGVTLRLPT